MPVSVPRSRAVLLLFALIGLLAAFLAPDAMATSGRGALYTQTNDPSGNAVQAFRRGHDGSLTPAGTFATGGNGLATLGGRQGAVELSGDGRFLYAVNAGSDSVTVFRVGHRRHAVERVAIVASGGAAPASIAEHRGRVYVLNSGAAPNVTAFWRGFDGSLKPIPGGTRLLAPGADGAAQVSVTPDGRALVVSERIANRLETLKLDRFGRPGAPVITPSSGAVPFGFAISRHGNIVVSEAGASTVSSYRASWHGGALQVITPSLPVGQGAACWVAISPSGAFAYTGNAAGSISGFAIGRDGSLTPLDADGLTAPLTPSPRDLDFDEHGRFLHAVSPGTAATGGQVTTFRVERDGSLTRAGSAPAAAGITGATAS
jgi:6-phosphogluconolactonase (cycloisomerase 2 family)